MSTEQLVINKKMGGAFRSNTFMQLNKSSRMSSSLGLRMEDTTAKPELTSDYTAVVLRAIGEGAIQAGKYIEVSTGVSISPRGFHAVLCLSPEILSMADVVAPTVIMPGTKYDVKLRLKTREATRIEDLPILGYIMLVG